MRKKDGAVLVTFRHFGSENAEKVIEELKKRRLKEGDLVAVEQPPWYVEWIREEIESGRMKKRYEEALGDVFRIKEEMAWGVSPAKKKQLQQELDKATHRVGGLNFNIAIFSFLFSRNARIVGLESERMRKRISALQEKKEAGHLDKKQKRILDLITIPVREARWKKLLKPETPRFVLAGAAHKPALKRMMSYTETLTIGDLPRPRKERIKESLRVEFDRLYYKSRKVKRKIRRAFKV